MSRLISDILEAPEPTFSHTIQAWEQKSNRPGHDLRLLSDIAKRRKSILNSLNLDENDTAPKEMFYALQQKAAETNQLLEKKLKILDLDNPERVFQKIILFIDSLTLKNEVWVLKPTVLKELLKKQPPKKLLKILGLRSIDSVLKRSSPRELLALAYEIEGADWKLKMHQKIKKLKPTDFYSSKPHLYLLDKTKTEKLRKAGYKGARSVNPVYETGTILLIQSKKRFKMDTLGLMLFILQSIYDLRLHSSYFRHISVKNDFGDRLYEVLRQGIPGKIKDAKIGWKPLRRHLLESDNSFEKVEQPYLQSENMTADHPLEVLFIEVPEAELWNNISDNFYHTTGRPVSMHLMDVVINAANQVPYEKATRNHLKAQLWEELGYRYLKNEPIQALVIEDI